MPELQLPVAVALAVTSAVSAVAYAIDHGSDEGKIHLAEDSADSEHDPFAVTTPEDIIDGEPLNEAAFWANIRLRKLIVTLFAVVILALQTVSLAWSATDLDKRSVGIFAVHTLVALYTLIMSAISVPQSVVLPHTYSVIHMSIVTFMASFLLGATAILPSTYHITSSLDDPLQKLWYTVLGLYLLSFMIVSTTPLGPALHFPVSQIYDEKTVSQVTNNVADNVCGVVGASVWSFLLFSYTTRVVKLGNTSESLEIGDLPIVPGDMRASTIYASMKIAMRTFKLRIRNWVPKPGSGWGLGYTLAKLNGTVMITQLTLAVVSACVFYVPALVLRELIRYLEADPAGVEKERGWFLSAALFTATAIMYLLTGQLWSISTTTFQVRLKVQLNSILFAKTLVRKDIASSAASAKKDDDKPGDDADSDKKKDENEFSSKVMTLMTTDVDRVSEFSWHLFSLIDAPIEIAIGSIFLYKLLGVSSLIGLLVSCIFLPLNHFAGKVVVKAQDGLMESRDERVALMNEILGAIRMLKFMAWERSFEKKAMKVRAKELRFQRMNYLIETVFSAIWEGSPLLVTLISFWHFAVWRNQTLSPSIAFTSISVFNEMRFALNALPETFINMLQSLVSLRRIERYLQGAEITPVPSLDSSSQLISMTSATLSWPQARSVSVPSASESAASSTTSTPARKFMLVDISAEFPAGELSLICGKLGAGKTLFLLSLLGEADVLTGQVLCPRSPPDSLAAFATDTFTSEDWIVPGLAYVPQAAWLRNASIKDNILFSLPYNEERYRKTLEVTALLNDLEVLEDGDESEIGERGVNLSGGQKARVSLARAVYSRASVLLLDDVLSAVDAHTAQHLYTECLKGDLMRGRTVILVSHHVALCAPGAAYVVALDNGRLSFAGPSSEFLGSAVMETLVQSKTQEAEDPEDPEAIADEKAEPGPSSETASTITAVANDSNQTKDKKKGPRKLVEEEKRAVGRVSANIWMTYIKAVGTAPYWLVFVVLHLLGAVVPVVENSWLRYWSKTSSEGTTDRSPSYYIGVYAAITGIGILLKTMRPLILYIGSLRASRILYEQLLESVLFAQIRFHDTVSRGRLLNRFGKDFESVDSSLADNFGRTFIYTLNVITTFATISYIGGWQFLVAAVVIGLMYFDTARLYNQTSRDMRRLDSVTRSPLYSMYGETIAGVPIIRAFGASSKFLRDMLRCVDVNVNPYYWMWGVNRWLSVRFNMLSSIIVGVTGFVVVTVPGIDAALAGVALTFAMSVTGDILFMTRRFVGLEQSMVAIERVKEYIDLVREPPEFVEPRPPASWPAEGSINVKSLSIRYAPELPNVLHGLDFNIKPGEKVGVLGRTGSGKSTLALSFFRFVEATEGSVEIDDIDISRIGLADLRSKLTIIPQDPTILSGTLRSTLDVFDEYDDAQIFEALRRVHLIPSAGTAEEDPATVNANVFRNLDSPVSEGGENFSTGEKQLLCMARAILKRTKVLIMDEATASVDYATDELISKTIREEFSSSTMIVIAHRLRTVISYDRVMVLEQGKLKEFDQPKVLLADPTSAFYQLCKASGREEFVQLRKMAGL